MNIKIKEIHSIHRLGHRANQEDSRWPDADLPVVEETVPAFVVCDGVGGSEKGEVASSTIASSIAKSMTKWYGAGKNRVFADNDLQKVLSDASQALFDALTPSSEGMATTLTFIAMHKGGCLAAHIGDSRIYHVRPGCGILYRSDDHSLVHQLVRSGNLAPALEPTHPRSNIITRCMQAAEERDDTATVLNITDIAAGDYFMLCSDGVLHGLSDAELISILSDTCADAEKMAKIADACRESRDNNTAILVSVDSVTLDKDEVPTPAIISRVTPKDPVRRSPSRWTRLGALFSKHK